MKTSNAVFLVISGFAQQITLLETHQVHSSSGMAPVGSWFGQKTLAPKDFSAGNSERLEKLSILPPKKIALQSTVAAFRILHDYLKNVNNDPDNFKSVLPTFRNMQEESKHLSYELLAKQYLLEKDVFKIYSDTTINVVNGDSFTEALKLVDKKLNPAVLNMANEKVPGGGVVSGGMAQEEDLCRTSTLYAALDPELNPRILVEGAEDYGIGATEVIYTPDVAVMYKTVVTDRRTKHLELLSGDFPKVDVISSAAIALRGGRPTNYEAVTKTKINAQILSAICHKKDSLVLGAFGCGMFGGDPQEVSQLYYNALVTDGLKKHFKEIVFGVLVVNKRDEQNFQHFRNKFLHA